MKKLGVHVHPSEPVQKVLNNKVSTKRGEYVFDLIIVCTGVKPNTISTDTKFHNGYPINNYCVIEQYNTVYAIGDVSSFKMNNRMLPNLAQTAKSQADYVIKDIIRREKKNKRKRFKPRILTQFISVGKHYAVAHFLRWVSIKGFLAWLMKKTYYFYDIFRVDKKGSLLKIYLKSIIFSNKYFF
jgi:NADH dehydrogenase FAD-containing subunit